MLVLSRGGSNSQRLTGSGRALQGKKTPKTLNVSKLKLYSKRKLLSLLSATIWIVQRIQTRTGQFFETRYILQLLILQNIHLVNTKLGLMRRMIKSNGFLKKNTTCTRLLAQYLRGYWLDSSAQTQDHARFLSE